MATTKKTTAKKAATPKKAPAPKKPVVEESAEQLSLPKAPEPVVNPHEETVRYVIPRDNSLESSDQFFEYNLNGVNYRFMRGVVLEHPRKLYDAISAVLFRRERISPYIAEFMNTSKKLN